MIDHFAFLAPIYERVIPFRNLERMIAYINLPVDGALLDAGGGTGRVSGELAHLVSSATVTDISWGMLQRAHQKKNLSTLCAQSEALCFADDSFERVIMVDAFHHVIDQEITAFELWRVLKPGGRLVIEEPDIQRASVKIVAFVEKLTLMRSHFLKPTDIAGLFKFPNSIVQIEYEGFNAWIIVDKN
jgi:ubiquinone/menaquinone biosynthesis C-methylase UbiE